MTRSHRKRIDKWSDTTGGTIGNIAKRQLKYIIMISIKLAIDKLDKQLMLTPTVVVDYSQTREKTIMALFGWLNLILCASVNWSTAKSDEENIK